MRSHVPTDRAAPRDLLLLRVRGPRAVHVAELAAGHAERAEGQCQPGANTRRSRRQQRLVGQSLGVGPAAFLEGHAGPQVERTEEQRLVVESPDQCLGLLRQCRCLVASAELAQGVCLADGALGDTTEVTELS